MPNHPETITHDKFGGLNNKFAPEHIPESLLEILDNFDVDVGGGLHLRDGYTNLIAGTNAHSLWSNGDKEAFYVDENVLYQIDPENVTQRTGVASVLHPNRVGYYSIGSRTYFSNGSTSGVIENGTSRPWGIPTPAITPLTTTISGQLTAGTYQVAIRYVATDGRVSGSRTAGIHTLPVDNSGIHLFGLQQSADPSVSHTEIYCSTPDGDTLYRAGTTTDTTFDIVDLHGDMIPLDHQFVQPCPGGDIVELFAGRLFLASGRYLFYSNPLNYEMFDAHNYVEFPAEITNVMPVDDGIFITADRLYFLEGSDPKLFRQREREIYRAAKYTAVKIVGGDVILENIPTGMKWLVVTDKGIVMVGTGGMVFNLTEKTVMIDKAETGAAIFRSKDGMNQFLSVLSNPSNQRLRVGDTVTTTVIRNGIEIT